MKLNLQYYKNLNDMAKNSLEPIIKNIVKEKYNNDEYILERCNQELDMLYQTRCLIIIYLLYNLKQDINFNYYFGIPNNYFINYILGLSKINSLPKKYGGYNLKFKYEKLPYSYISLMVDKVNYKKLINIINKQDYEQFVLIKDESEYNSSFKTMFKLIPRENFESLNIKKNKNNMYILKEKNNYLGFKIKILYSYNLETFNDNYEEFIKMLKPKTVDDYIKIIGLGNLNDLNIYDFIKKYNLPLNNILVCEEDIENYMKKYNIKEDLIDKILRLINDTFYIKDENKRLKSTIKFKKSVDILKKAGCEEYFIEFITMIFNSSCFILPKAYYLIDYYHILDSNIKGSKKWLL